MSELEKAIIQVVSEAHGIKAKDIALKIGCERSTVNAALYGTLRSRCHQDSAYKWYLNERISKASVGKEMQPPDRQLSSLCKYYLNCLSLEQSNGISAFLKSNFSLNYVELKDINIDGADEGVSKLIRRASAEKDLTIHMGYPVLIEKLHSIKTNKDYLKVAPVFLFQIEITDGSVKTTSIPCVNMEVIKQYSSRDINSQVYDLVDLESELGLNSSDYDIDLDELVARLQSIREWQWRDHLDPAAINTSVPLSSLSEEGIYNRAILIVSERSPYTVGLESGLSQLSQKDISSYQGTALYDWIHGSFNYSSVEGMVDTPLLEVLPTNTEQESAIRHAMEDALTIVTGPPGTGKSQVVTNLLVNAAWNDKNVLFTSKNNKAVDVVETRVNSLGKRPIMLRIGSNQYAYHLAELIQDLLSYSADQSDRDEYNRYKSIYQDKLSKYQKLQEEKMTVIGLRNHVDHMEQKTCELRDNWGKWFNKITEDDAENCELAAKNYHSTYQAWAHAKSSFWGKLFWFAIGKNKTNELENAVSGINKWLVKFGQVPVEVPVDPQEIKQYKKDSSKVDSLTDTLHTISEYKTALKGLLQSAQPEDIDHEIIDLKNSLADVAAKLWNKWLVTRPLQMNAANRQEMNEYISAMRLIGDVDLNDYPDIRKQFNKLQKEMTNFLPCWAVTSLSAKGRVPFQPGLFDLVVIDEASQCDIASVLPMLYRAKRAVIIGDPKQLSHISTISKTQDLTLLQRYGVNMGWSYSANSLFSLASSLSEPERIIQLRDHHRSFGEIIEFSNSEFYDKKLRVATNYDRLICPRNVDAGIRWIDVIGKTVRPSTGGAYNTSEVSCIIAEIKRLVIDNDYVGSVGVVTPFRAQAEQIRAAIDKEPALKEQLYEKNDFLVDTVHKFQGDERDMMFFSPVISQGTSQGAIGFLNNTGNLFNVAVTRARAVLVVVGDANYCSSCGVSYMEHFVEYVRRVKERNKDTTQDHSREYDSGRVYPKVTNPEQVSDWERSFYTALYDQGIKTIPQYPVDKYKLDLAIVIGSRKLDIEVDGEMYHKDWNGELSYRDQLRNQRLYELGWDVKRFWVYQIRDQLPDCIKQVQSWIDE
jgi:very-short-patch-repair endonuclease